MRSFAARLAGVLALALALLPLGGGVAAAHGGALEPNPSIPRIIALDPPVDGLTVTVIESGARLRLDNGTGVPVDVRPPPGTERTVEPVVAPGTTYRWADPRIDAAMLDRPDQGTRPWSIPLMVGDRAVTIVGEQVWPAPPPTGLWWLATALAAVGAALLGTTAVHRRWAAVATASVTLAVVAAHVVHVLGASLVPDGHRSYLVVALGTAGIGIGAWLFGVAGAALTLAGRSIGLLFCSLAGAVLALITAFDAVAFANAVLPFAGSPDVDRATVVLTFGAGAGLFLTGFAVLRALTPAAPAAPGPAR